MSCPNYKHPAKCSLRVSGILMLDSLWTTFPRIHLEAKVEVGKGEEEGRIYLSHSISTVRERKRKEADRRVLL